MNSAVMVSYKTKHACLVNHPPSTMSSSMHPYAGKGWSRGHFVLRATLSDNRSRHWRVARMKPMRPKDESCLTVNNMI